MTNSVTVQMYYSGGWQDVTAAGEVRRSIVINTSRYAASQTRRVDPGQTRMMMANETGKYNPANPLSPIYGLIGQNTPIKVLVDGDIRWTGAASAWKPARPLGPPRYCEITGGGVLRRLGIGTAPLMSALTAGVMALTPVLYLPMVDGPLATVAGTPLPLGATADAAGVTFGKVDGPPGDTRKLPELSGDGVGGATAWVATLPTPTGDDWTIDLVARGVRKPGVFNTFNLLEWTTGLGTANEVSWGIAIMGDLVDDLILFAYEPYGANTLVTHQTSQVLLTGDWHHYRIQSIHTAGTTEVWVTIDNADTEYVTGPLFGAGISTVQIISAYDGVLTSGSVGHIAVYDSPNPGDSYTAFTGHVGEMAADRFSRLCSENSIAWSVIGTPATDSRPMGPHVLVEAKDCMVRQAVLDHERTMPGTI